MRKIIQISVSTNLDGYNKSQVTVALCDDGTVWFLETFDVGWVKYPDIPQDKTSIFSRSDDSECFTVNETPEQILELIKAAE